MNSFCKVWRPLYSVLLPFVTQHFNKISDGVFLDTVVKGLKGLLELSCAASCLHIGISPMWPAMFWVSSRRNCTVSWGSLFQSLPILMVIFFFFYYIEISYIPACVFCGTSFYSAHLEESDSILIFPKVVAAALRSPLFWKGKGWSNIPVNLGVLKLLYLLSVWVSACQLINSIQLWFRMWINNLMWGTLVVHGFSLWEIWNNLS